MNFFWSLVHKQAASEALLNQFLESKILGTSNGTVAHTSVTLEFIKTVLTKKNHPPESTHGFMFCATNKTR